MQKRYKNLFAKSVITAISCLSAFVQAANINWPATAKIEAAEAPNAIVFAAENNEAEKHSDNNLQNKPIESDGQLYQVQQMSSGDIAAPYVQRKIETPVMYSTAEAADLTLPSMMYSTAEAADITQPSVMSTFTPLCSTLSTGTLYTINGATTGGSYCYHFNVPQRSKTTVLLVNQAVNNNVNLTLFRHEADNTLTTLGQSKNSGNADEKILVLTEPGDYYWYMEAIDVDGTPFNFAAVVNTVADSYELNDTANSSTALPDRFNQVIGNMDSTTDVDYFNFTATRGQDLRFVLKAEDSGSSDEWLFEYYDGNVWQRLGTSGNDYVLTGIPVGYTLHVRVLPNTVYTVNPSRNYKLSIGSTVRQLTYSSVKGEKTVLEVPYSATPSTGYLTTQAYHDLTWSVRLADSTGAALEGETVNFNYRLSGQNNGNYITSTNITDSSGRASGTVNLGACDGRFTSGEHYSYNNGVKSWWTTSYNYGSWNITVPNSFIEDHVGVGPDPDVSIGHLCKQNFIRSEY